MKKVALKLCGNRSVEDLKKTAASRAQYIGVVFARSKRQVSPLKLKQWLKEVKLREDQKLVGIFVNPTIEEIEMVLSYISLDIIQAHGDETVPYILHIKEVTRLPVWKVIHHGDNAIQKMRAYEGIVDGYVIDAKHNGQWGGTGTVFDWSHVPSYLNEARRQRVPCFIAGGITPENAQEILKYKPDGIDLSSGIESSSSKDKVKIQQLEERLIEYEQTVS